MFLMAVEYMYELLFTSNDVFALARAISESGGCESVSVDIKVVAVITLLLSEFPENVKLFDDGNEEEDVSLLYFVLIGILFIISCFFWLFF